MSINNNNSPEFLLWDSEEITCASSGSWNFQLNWKKEVDTYRSPSQRAKKALDIFLKTSRELRTPQKNNNVLA